MSDRLIRTKLQRPRAGTRLVTRARLLAVLGEQTGRRLTVVVAPAGFGKTTLVSQWLANVERRTRSVEQPDSEHTDPVLRSTLYALRSAWLSLDEDDNDLGRYWRYLLAAVQRAYPGSCVESEALLGDQQTPPPHRLADYLANDLADLPGPLVLVLDDYHHITSQDLHNAMTRLVEYLPEHVQLVLTSRIDLPWALSRLRGQGQVTEVRAADLRFSAEEVRDLLSESVAGGQLDEAAELLCARTEGWAVALQLARLSLRATLDLGALASSLRGTSRNIADYLLDEVLGQQPEDVQRSLLILAVPERFCQHLCDVLLNDAPDGAGQVVAADLERRGLFLVALDDERTWYRFHHLVRDLLTARLKEVVGPERVAALHRRCSAWFAGRGLIEEAVRHALHADDQALAARIVEDGYRMILERDEGLVKLGPLLALLPEAIIQARPRLLLARAYNAYIRWDFGTAIAIAERVGLSLDTADTPLTAEEIDEFRGDTILLQGIMSFWGGNTVRALAQTEEAMGRIAPARSYLYATAIAYQAGARQQSGDVDGALSAVRQASRGFRPDSRAGAQLALAAVLINFYAGRLNRILEDIQPLLKPAAGKGYIPWGHNMLARNYYERGEFERAQQHFLEATRFPYGATPRVHHDSLCGLARICLARGEFARAEDSARAARAYAQERASPVLLEASAALDAGRLLARGDLDGASRLVARIDPASYTGTALWLEQPRQRLAQVQILQGTVTSLDKALKNLERYLVEAEAVHNVYRQIHVGALLALARDARGQREQALLALGHAVSLAAPGGYVRSFVDYGPPMASLLSGLAPGHMHEAYIRGILAAFDAPPHAEDTRAVEAPEPGPSAANLVSPLTEREHEILALLAERLTDQEIAERLIIAITTVRTHTHRIYGKLEVENRRQAISRARELGLLAAGPGA